MQTPFIAALTGNLRVPGDGMAALEELRMAQAVAKSVLAALGPTIITSDTERTIAERAASMMAEHGVHETWYYSCPALVLLGSRSCLSISGNEYVPSDEKVGTFNLVTVDLSPMLNGAWGDCARSFCIEKGSWTPRPTTPAFARGLIVEEELHRAMRDFIRPSTTFAELFRFSNAEITQRGFKNLDFLQNVGHSIEARREARCYVDIRNQSALGDVGLFTFEPHIAERGSEWGFKHENIYHFDERGRAAEL